MMLAGMMTSEAVAALSGPNERVTAEPAIEGMPVPFVEVDPTSEGL
jgi:hypothetical protein